MKRRLFCEEWEALCAGGVMLFRYLRERMTLIISCICVNMDTEADPAR